jgi:hypothetical protein
MHPKAPPRSPRRPISWSESRFPPQLVSQGYSAAPLNSPAGRPATGWGPSSAVGQTGEASGSGWALGAVLAVWVLGPSGHVRPGCAVGKQDALRRRPRRRFSVQFVSRLFYSTELCGVAGGSACVCRLTGAALVFAFGFWGFVPSSCTTGGFAGPASRCECAPGAAPRCVYKTKPTTSQLVLAGASFSAWLVLIPSCQQRVALLVRSRAGQAEAEAAASSAQLLLRPEKNRLRRSASASKKIACRQGGGLGRSI